jgi:nitrate/nitrite transporter NarK
VLRALLTNRTLLANYWAFFVFGYFLFFFMTWLPSYLHRQYGLNVGAVGLFTVLPWLAAAFLLWLLGRWSDHLLATTGRLRIARSYLIAGSQFVAALAVIPVALTDDLTVAIIGITVAVAASMGANAAYYAVNVDIVPRRAATALGIMDFGFAVAGFLAPAITGWVLNLRGSFTDAFLLMAALALSSVLAVLLFHHPDRDREDGGSPCTESADR